MNKKFTNTIISLKLRTTVGMMFLICILVFLTIMLINTFSYIISTLDIYEVSAHTPWFVSDITFKVRMLENAIIAGIPEEYELYKHKLAEKKNIIDNNYIPIMNEYLNDYTSSYPLFVPVGKYSYDLLKTSTIYDSYMQFVSNYKYALNINSKENFGLIYDESSSIINELVNDKITVLYTVLITCESLFVIVTLVVTFNTFGPLRRITDKLTYGVFRMFKNIPRDTIGRIIDDYSTKIDELAESLDIEKEVLDFEYNKKSHKSKWNVFVSLSCIILLIYSSVVVYTQISEINEINDTVKIIKQSSERLYYIQNIQLYTYEVVNQDRTLFLEGEPERIINDLIYKLKTNQEALRDGSYGGPSFDNYPGLNHILKNSGCHRSPGDNSCETINYNETSAYGFNKEVATLPLNEQISQYLFYVENFLGSVESGKYIQLPFTTAENIYTVISNVIKDDFFKLQQGFVDNIINSLNLLDDYLIENIDDSLDQGKSNCIILLVIGTILISFIDLFIIRIVYSLRIHEMKSLVSFAFLVPPDIYNRIEPYKRFLETGQIDD
ncbi:hypothetical protein BCR32DRAFT_266292 [Anaeromyces robustus]|uniref:Uncharacterized protein n=1 Tax=Anaeromyces robustus TaxID=1754192 RepID=A0A1Y1XFL3_9FUNG|nr:hypothetical protein BCR32DRAFT_266292 [Anaeromyces robustus]|eukprot:ORX84507.1 hypothetical protein BCR32DRAFT_266292 [Anaeromyces robustus]